MEGARLLELVAIGRGDPGHALHNARLLPEARGGEVAARARGHGLQVGVVAQGATLHKHAKLPLPQGNAHLPQPKPAPPRIQRRLE